MPIFEGASVPHGKEQADWCEAPTVDADPPPTVLPREFASSRCP